MNISKISAQNTHKKWCLCIMREQKQSIGRVRKLLRKSCLENPFVKNKQTDAILAGYEKNFFGSGVCWKDIPRLI